MTITLHWWMIPIALILFPFIFRIVRPFKPYGGFLADVDYEGMLIGIICWVLAVGVCVGRWLK